MRQTKMRQLLAKILCTLFVAGQLLGSAQAAYGAEAAESVEEVLQENENTQQSGESKTEDTTAGDDSDAQRVPEEADGQETPKEEADLETSTEEERVVTEDTEAPAAPAVEESKAEPAVDVTALAEEENEQEKVGDTVESTAPVAPQSEFYTLTVKLRGETKALDIAGGSKANGANAQIYQTNGSAAQLFRLEKRDKTYYRIINVLSGKVLDVAGANKQNGANVQQDTWNGTAAQLWKITPDKKGGYVITSKLNGKALDVVGARSENKTNVQLYTANGSAAQRWHLTAETLPLSLVTAGTINPRPYRGTAVLPGVSLSVAGKKLKKDVDYTTVYENNEGAGTAKITITGAGAFTGTKTIRFKIFEPAETIESGKTYTLLPKRNTALAIDVKNGGLVNNTALWLYQQNGTEAQKFTLTKNKDGSYTFVNQGCELSIDVAGNSQANGAKVQLYDANGTNAQKWNFRENEDGTFTILNKQSKKAIDIPGGSAKQKAPLQMYADNQTDAQRYYLVETEGVEKKYPGTYMLVTRAKNYMVMDAVGAGKADGTNIQLYFGNRTNAQKFRFKYSGKGTYRIENVNSGKVLTTKGNSSANKANIELGTWRGQKGQRFKIVDAGKGFVFFQSLLGTVIEVPGANTIRRQNIATYALNKTAAQQWKIANPSDVPIYKGTQASEYTTLGETASYGDPNSKKVKLAKETIIKVLAEASLETHESTNFPRSVLIAQAILESGWMSFHESVKEGRRAKDKDGKYYSGMLPKYNNILGMNKDLGNTQWNSPWGGKYVKAAVPQWNPVTKKEYLRVETMRQYVDIETCFLDYARFRIAQKKTPIKKGTSAEAVMEVYLPGYATNPSYADHLKSIIYAYNLKKYDK